MNDIIFVNSTAATEGGALTILKQFLERISVYLIRIYIIKYFV